MRIWLRETVMRTRSLAVLVILAVRGCKGAGPARQESREQTVAGVRFVELFARGADEASPLLVGLHGRGGTPERFMRVWRDFPAKLEIALAQAPLPYADGGEWFDWPPAMTDDALADVVSAAEARLWPAIAELAHGRKVLVSGFSQGAVLAYVMAVRHPDAVAYAFPIAGRMPSRLLPRGSVRTAPVYALHGTADDMIGIDASRETIAAFQAIGAPAELREFAGVGHTIAPEMRDELVARVRAVIGNGAAPARTGGDAAPTSR